MRYILHNEIKYQVYGKHFELSLYLLRAIFHIRQSVMSN